MRKSIRERAWTLVLLVALGVLGAAPVMGQQQVCCDQSQLEIVMVNCSEPNCAQTIYILTRCVPPYQDGHWEYWGYETCCGNKFATLYSINGGCAIAGPVQGATGAPGGDASMFYVRNCTGGYTVILVGAES